MSPDLRLTSRPTLLILRGALAPRQVAGAAIPGATTGQPRLNLTRGCA